MSENPSPRSLSPASAGEGETRNVHAMALDRASVDLTIGKYAHVSTCVEAAHEIDRLQSEALRLRADAERLRTQNKSLRSDRDECRARLAEVRRILASYDGSHPDGAPLAKALAAIDRAASVKAPASERPAEGEGVSDA